jgi:hypothetical protein
MLGALAKPEEMSNLHARLRHIPYNDTSTPAFYGMSVHRLVTAGRRGPGPGPAPAGCQCHGDPARSSRYGHSIQRYVLLNVRWSPAAGPGTRPGRHGDRSRPGRPAGFSRGSR